MTAPALVAFSAIPRTAFERLFDRAHTIAQEVCPNRKPLFTYKNQPAHITQPEFIGLGKALKELQPFEGLSLAEIGGNFGARFFSALGGEAVSFDADMSGGFALFAAAASPGFSPTKVMRKPEEIVSLENHKDFLPDKYDFTLTNKIMDEGTGIEVLADLISDEFPDELGSLELLAVCSNATKNGGYSIHGGINQRFSEEQLDFFGLYPVWYMTSSTTGLLVATKKDPNPERFPDGLRIGRKKILYDSNSKEFSIRRD